MPTAADEREPVTNVAIKESLSELVRIIEHLAEQVRFPDKKSVQTDPEDFGGILSELLEALDNLTSAIGGVSEATIGSEMDFKTFKVYEDYAVSQNAGHEKPREDDGGIDREYLHHRHERREEERRRRRDEERRKRRRVIRSVTRRRMQDHLANEVREVVDRKGSRAATATSELNLSELAEDVMSYVEENIDIMQGRFRVHEFEGRNWDCDIYVGIGWKDGPTLNVGLDCDF